MAASTLAKLMVKLLPPIDSDRQKRTYVEHTVLSRLCHTTIHTATILENLRAHIAQIEGVGRHHAPYPSEAWAFPRWAEKEVVITEPFSPADRYGA